MKTLAFLALLGSIALVAGASNGFTILHLTDVHGWINGHPHQPNLNADFGDLVSLVSHVRANAAANGEDFLLLDTGDLIEGTGLSDASDIHGQYIFPVAQNVAYDALTIGNHDMGHEDTISLMEKTFIPFMGDKYVTSNTVSPSTNKALGSSFRVLTTAQGKRVLVLGYIYNFDQNANNTHVVYMAESLKQPYFQDAMRQPNIDLIVTLNHIDPQSQKSLLMAQYKAIRASHPNTPLVVLAGHRHVTYFEKYDDNAFTIESGRYFEKFGWIQFNLGAKGDLQNLQYSWPETSLTKFYQLSNTNAQSFDTPLGLQVKQQIKHYWDLLDLGHVYGCSPYTYNPYADYNNPYSEYRLFVESIMPTYYAATNSTPFFITNGASLRANIYQGPVNKNDVLSVYPFENDFEYIASLPGSILQKLVNYISPKTVQDSHQGHLCGEPSLKEGTGYFMSNVTISATNTYDMIASSYDMTNMKRNLGKLYPGSTFPSAVYPGRNGPLSSTGVLIQFMTTKWPCN